MTSQRTSSPGNEKILLARREAVVLHGVRRTTANDIAERTGVSRLTFSRQMGSVGNAALAMLTREFRAGAAEVRSAAPAGSGRQQLVHFAISGVRVLATSELLGAIAERNPEFLFPYVTDRFGACQQLALGTLEALLEAVRSARPAASRPRWKSWKRCSPATWARTQWTWRSLAAGSPGPGRCCSSRRFRLRHQRPQLQAGHRGLRYVATGDLSVACDSAVE